MPLFSRHLFSLKNLRPMKQPHTLLKISLLFLLIFHCEKPHHINTYNIQALYTDPMGNSFAMGSKIESSISGRLANAKSSIDLALYEFDSRQILQALIKAKTAGTDIRIIGDFSQCNNPGYNALRQNGFFVVCGNHYGIQHNKFAIIDKKAVITGTGNFTHAGFYCNDNHYLFINNPHLAFSYSLEFSQMYSGFFSSLKSSHQPVGNFSSNQAVKVYFSPQESQLAIQNIIFEIDHAKESVYYMIYAFTYDEIATALIRAARRGVSVYGIHDSGFLYGISQEATRLYTAGFDAALNPYPSGPFVHADGNTNTININGAAHGGKMHCKTLLIDPDTNHGTLITGSFNWSNNATTSNDENLLLIKNNALIHTIKQQWQTAWRHSEKLSGLLPSGSIAKPHDILLSEFSSAGTFENGSLNRDDDFIEIFNNSTKTLDITNWTLTWQENNFIHSYSFAKDSDPAGHYIIQPGQYRIIYGFSQGTIAGITAFLQNGLKIPNSKNFYLPDTDLDIALYDRAMNLIDKLHYKNRALQFDPLSQQTFTLNRRLPQNHAPEDGWFLSKQECPWPACQNPHLNGSPGYPNEPLPPPTFVNSQYLENGNLLVTFSGDIDQCTAAGNFLLNSLTTPPSFQVTTGPLAPNQLIFQSNSFNDPLQSFQLNSPAFAQYSGLSINAGLSNLYLGTLHQISYSTDNGQTFLKSTLPGLEELSVYHIEIDPATNTIYLASSNGLYVSTDNGLTFLKIVLPLSGYEAVYDVKVNTTSIALATSEALLITDKAFSNPQILLPGQFFSLYLSDTLLFAGSYNTLYRFDFPLPANPSIIYTPGKLHSIAYLNGQYLVGSSSGLYASTDGLSFLPLYSSVLNSDSVYKIIAGPLNQLVFLNAGNITGLFASGTLAVFPLWNGTPEIIFDLLQKNGLYYSAGLHGLMSGSAINQLIPAANYECSPACFLPSGRLVFSGYDATNPTGTAALILNEVSLENPDGHDWIELYAETGGTLNDIRLEYYENAQKSQIYAFSNTYVTAGGVILVRLNHSTSRRLQLSFDRNLVKKLPYTAYSTHSNLNRGDGILILRKDNLYLDLLYYSNRDGNVSSGLMNGPLKEIYFDPNKTAKLPMPIPYPVNSWNDLGVQNSAIAIPASGYNRAISRVNNVWTIVSSPSPGVK